MSQIRAFVGHSFVEEDAELVRKFLQQFRRISGLHPAFSWVSAEAAEPKVLSEKVLSLVHDANLFIGICTRKELVVDPHVLSIPLLQPAMRKASKYNFRWETSDWMTRTLRPFYRE